MTLYVPSVDLVRQGAHLSESGVFLGERTLPRKLVKEAWFCVPVGPYPGHSWKFDIIDKILDYSLEDEVVQEADFHPRIRHGHITGSLRA